MKAKALKRLADVSDIIKLDNISPNALILKPDYAQDQDGADVYTLSAVYAGQYHSCEVTVSTDSATIANEVAVGGAEFKPLVAIFDDDSDVMLEATSSDLVIKSGSRKVSLRYNTRLPIDPLPLVVDSHAFTVNRARFIQESSLAMSVCATSMTAPILTGVRVVASVAKQKIAFQAADGHAMLYQSFIDAKVEQDFVVVLPNLDASSGLKLLNQGEDMYVGAMGSTVLFSCEGAKLRIPTLSGNWPSFNSLMASTFDDEMTVMPSTLRALVAGVKAYKASDDCIIRPWMGATVIESREGDLGQFQERIEGTVRRAYIMPIDGIERAATISDDGLVTFSLSEKMTLAKSGDRRLYVMPKSQ